MRKRKVLAGQTKLQAKSKTAPEVYPQVKRNDKYKTISIKQNILTILYHHLRIAKTNYLHYKKQTIMFVFPT